MVREPGLERRETVRFLSIVVEPAWGLILVREDRIGGIHSDPGVLFTLFSHIPTL